MNYSWLISQKKIWLSIIIHNLQQPVRIFLHLHLHLNPPLRHLEPVLESFLPCTLRLMGVRISCFRDQKQLLLKGPLDEKKKGPEGTELQMVPSKSYFPTCQVRVVRFYQSCSLPPRLALLLLLLRLLLQFLLDHVCINFHLYFRLANSSPNSSLTSELRAHCWTSTWDLSSSVRTAGPQPGTFPAQCALLDLNLGPSQLSVHRWTSTWDLPSSVCTAGPQPGTFPAQCAPLDLNLGPSQLSVHRWTSTAT